MGFKYKYMQKTLVILLILFLLIIHLPSICSEQYYADITIYVDDSGFVTIDGYTNHPDILTVDSQLYVTKKQSYWILNITKNDIFSDFLYTLKLPKGTSINYVKSSGLIRIENNLGNLIIKGFGQNESLEIIIQYQIEKVEETYQNENIFTYLLLFILIICIILLIGSLKFYKVKNNKKVNFDNNLSSDETQFKGLNDRQKQIIHLLIKNKTPLTQADIQKELKIPKAAVSRNIHALELKGLIEIEKIGMSNLIRIKKP